MSDDSSRVNAIHTKLHTLGKRFEQLTRENSELREKTSSLQVILEEKERKLESIQKEYDRLKLAKSVLSTGADKAEMKFKVNELVREIDKCIALLNR